MPNPQGPSPLGRKNPKSDDRGRAPTAPGYDKKLEGPNRPST